MSRTKALSGLKITDADKGLVTAVFATFDVKDHDGDVTLKGAFKSGQEVRISAYNHKSWEGALPVGRGTIKETSEGAVLEGEFFMDTTHGRDTFATVKGLGSLGEWSYGYDVIDAERGQHKGESVQFLKELDVTEVSPVLLGAGIGTRTTGIKGAKQLQSDLWGALQDAGQERWGNATTTAYVDDFDIDEGWAVYAIWSQGDGYTYTRINYARGTDGAVALTGDESEVEAFRAYRPKGRKQFSDHAEAVVTDVDALIDRAAEVKAMRLAKGKDMGEQSQELLARVDASLKRLSEVMASEPPSDNTQVDMDAELLRAEVHRAQGAIA